MATRMRTRGKKGRRTRRLRKAFGRLGCWRRHYLAPLAPGYLICVGVGTLLLMAPYWGAPIKYFAYGGVLLLLPVVVAFLGRLVRQGAGQGEYFGFVQSYWLSDRELVFMLCRTIPIYRVGLAGVKAVEPWRAVGPTAFGTDENNLIWFLFSRIWFWPRPLGFMVRKWMAAQAIRCEYVLICDSGWKIVLTCSRKFIERIAARVRRARSPAAG